MKLLAIGAHPDDIELGCAPLLLLEAAAGNAIHLVVLSRGEAGSAGTPEQRVREAEGAADLMGASLEWLDFGGDCHLESSPKNALALAAQIRRTQPDIVLAPSLAENQHPDHAAAGRMARDACRLARYAGLAELLPAPAHRISSLFYYTITHHRGAQPDIVIDVSGVVEAWKKVMACHASQVASRGYIDLQLAAARLLGLTIGVDYAVGVYANEPIRVERLSGLTLTSRAF